MVVTTESDSSSFFVENVENEEVESEDSSSEHEEEMIRSDEVNESSATVKKE